LVDGVRNGPFLILDVEDYTVQSIEAEDALYVFLDGVLQRKGYSYTVSGPNIFFNVPITKEMKIDMRYLYGRDVGQVINFYDYNPDTYFATGTLVIDSTASMWNTFSRYTWMGDKIGNDIQAWQVKPDGTLNTIGKVTNFYNSGTQVTFDVPQAQNAFILDNTDIIFGVARFYDRNITLDASDYTNATLTVSKDEVGRKVLRADTQIWAGTVLGKTYKNPFLSLSTGDKVRVEGEDTFRKIKQLPETPTSKDNRDGEQLTNEIFGTVSVESYTGITRGEGLSVIATVEGGSVTKLTWNQRSYEPLTQPTAYQYFTPPVLIFEPKNGDGGGASANVLVSKGQVISVDLIDGGSGYTEAPKVIVSRRFDVLSERGVGVSLINLRINPLVQTSGMTATSTVSVLGNRLVDAFSFSSIDLISPADTDREIEAEIQTGKPNIISGSSDGTMPVDDVAQPPSEGAHIVYIEPEPVEIEGQGGALNIQDNVTVVSAELQDIVVVNSISTVSRVITATQQIEIPNNAISNINYFENAAYLDVDFNIGNTIAYISDTSKFYGTGLLLVGDEVVSYARKLSDRFTNIIRGRRGTTEKDWVAGTFLRQIPELVSVAPVGVVTIESESDVTMVNASVTPGQGISRQRQIQIKSPPEFSVTREATEVVITPPPGGVVDGYAETAFLTDPIATRSGNTTGGHDGEVDIIDVADRYYVTQRDSTEILVTNARFAALEYIGKYTTTNAGHRIGHFDGIFDDGAANVSGMTLLEVSTYYSALTIRDFTDRRNSSYTLAGPILNLVPPSIQNPVAISSSSSLTSAINVQDTTYFPDAGYLFTNHGGVIQYTAKTSTSFTGCTLFRGSSIVTNGTQMIPFAIT